MRKIEKINLELTHKELVDYLARLAYEVQANKDVIAELIERNKDNISFLDSPIFKEYHKRFENAIASYNFAKNEFSKSVLPEKFQTKIDAFWDLTYDTYELRIEYEE
jgi:hypothetical protein